MLDRVREALTLQNYIVSYKEIGGKKEKKKKREQTSVNHNKNAKPRSKLLWPITKSKPNNPKAFEEHSPI